MRILKNYIEKSLKKSVINITSISSGVSTTYKVLLKNNLKVFVKYQNTPNDLLIKEAKELQLLAKFVDTPEILFVDNNILILSYLDISGSVNQVELAQALAKLHNKIMPYFGFLFDNKIGITPQYNAVGKNITNWRVFYWHYRLVKQIDLAYKNKLITDYEHTKLLSIKDTLPEMIPNYIKPVLLHGDLWYGNIISVDTKPYFIDTACYYGHNEVDLALTYMFGGFDTIFYNTYYAIHNKQGDFELRKPLYMLYHYLNHLNIFGSGYLSGVNSCLNKIIK